MAKCLQNTLVLLLMNFRILLITLVLAACGNGADAVLEQPPYAALTDSIVKSPTNAILYNHRAALLLQNEQDALAEKDFNTAYKLAPDEDNAIGAARFLIGRNTDSAVAFLEGAVKRVPQSLVLQISLARGYQQQKAYEQALLVCNRVIEAYPNQLDALVLRSEILKTQNKPAEAIATLEQAYYYAPFDAELVHTLAFDYAQALNPKALLLADSLLRADSSQRHAEPYYFKGVYYAGIGNKAAALAQFDEAIRHDYAFLDAHMEKGVLQFEMEQYSAAQKTFGVALSISPAYAYAYYWLGKVADAQGQRQEAKNNYLRAYNLDKTLTEAKTLADKI
jgi:tetratricopeptide (TPR) repeat protein